jgi:hypothetical protein
MHDDTNMEIETNPNPDAFGIRQGEAIYIKYRRLKLGGGQA